MRSEEEFNKSNSSHRKHYNDLLKKTTKYMTQCKLRKIEIRSYNDLIYSLLKDNRITKEELKKFLITKDEAIKLLKNNNESGI